jgi:hypothetical protein
MALYSSERKRQLANKACIVDAQGMVIQTFYNPLNAESDAGVRSAKEDSPLAVFEVGEDAPYVVFWGGRRYEPVKVGTPNAEG